MEFKVGDIVARKSYNYDVLFRISEETGIDFNLGNKEEWLSSFETDNYNNTQL